MILKVDHVGIAVTALEQRLPFWRDLLGLGLAGTESVASEGVNVAFLPAGESRVELLEATRPDSPIATFLGKRGEGIHHITFEVDAIQPLLDRMKEAGAPLLDRTPRVGAGGSAVAFLHPRATGGVLVEVVERAGGSRARRAGLAPGDPVLAYLRDPQEKVWGVLRDRDATGVTIEGMDLASVDAWTSQVEKGQSGIAPSVLFFPIGRLERLLLDRGTTELPSLSETFERRTGRRVVEAMGEV